MFKKPSNTFIAINKWLLRHKASVVNTFIILGTILSVLNGNLQSSKDDEISKLIFEVANVSVAYGNYVGNISEITLARSLVADCRVEHHIFSSDADNCASADKDLGKVIEEKPNAQSNKDEWLKTAIKDAQDFGSSVHMTNGLIEVTGSGALIFLVMALVVNSL